MMRSYVCQQCRLHLHRQLAPPRHPHLRSNRTIVSFRKTPVSPQPQTEAQRPPEVPNNERDTAQQQSNTDPERPQFRITKHDNRGQRPAFQDSSSAHASQRQHVRRGHTPLSNKSQTASIARKINEILATKTTSGVEEAWDLFNKTYTSRDVPALTDPSFGDINHLMGGRVFLELVASICWEFARGNAKLPTPTEVLFQYERLGITPVGAWKKTIADMTFEFLQSLSKEERTEAAGSASTEERGTEDIMAELLSVWKLFFQRHGAQDGSSALESISAEWKNIPETEVTFNTGRNFGLRLQQFHPLYRTSPELQFSAVAIFNHFFAEHGSLSATFKALRAQNRPFLDLLTSTMAGANIIQAFQHLKSDSRLWSKLPEDFRRSLVTQMEQAPITARKINGLDVSTAAPEERASHMVHFFIKRINKEVLMQSNASQLEKLWVEAETHYKTPDGNVQIPPILYNAFLRGFMTLFKPDHTVRIWNHMIAHNVVPDMETWLAMLVGCAKAKDIAGLDGVWKRMLSAGIEPDLRCWTMRIHGLISVGQVHDGMVALDEMGKRWLSAEKATQAPPSKGGKKSPPKAKMVNNCAKPGTGVINGAVTAIVGLPTRGKVLSRKDKGMDHKKKLELVQRILQWAGNFDIKPDVFTYNALISLYLDINDYATTFKLLRQMEKEGVEGDRSTHSLLLRAAFDNEKFDSLSPQDQAQRVIDLFQELEQGGMKPNGYHYSMAIDRMLKTYSNMVGVKMLMEHMITRGFRPGPQIFSSLATHYLQQSPPAIKELDALVARIFGPPAQPTDMYLFDRVIEGYARNDEIASALMVLTKMGAQGKRPSFRALGEVVKALYRAGDLERARSITRDVHLREGIAATGPMTTHNVNRKAFFQSIAATCPEVLEGLTRDHLSLPVIDGSAAVSHADHATQAMAGDGSAVGLEELYDQTQESYDDYASEEYPLSDQSHDLDAYEEAQMSNQRMLGMDDEFVNAEHAGYLSNEPETSQRSWEHSDQLRGDESSNRK